MLHTKRLLLDTFSIIESLAEVTFYYSRQQQIYCRTRHRPIVPQNFCNLYEWWRRSYN